MAIGREERRNERRPLVAQRFDAADVEAALDLFELLDVAWHDVYGDLAPPNHVVENVLTVASRSLADLIRASRLALVDRRDLQVEADQMRSQDSG